MLSGDRIKGCTRRLLESRMRILNNHGFFGLLLMHMSFSLDENLETAATDGQRIIFSPDFMDELSDAELDFIMMHEILHIALQHCLRGTSYDQGIFNIACDIVVNSNILKENQMNKASITLKKYGESMHIAPDGKEGFNYTAEQVYHMLSDGKKKTSSGGGGDKTDKSKNASGGNGGAGPNSKKGNAPGNSGFDDHSKWGSLKDEDGSLSDAWVKRVEDAAAAISVINAARGRGTMPLCIERLLKELHSPTVDWRTLLNNFIQTEICDYSFSPPDRRFDGTGFYLPDYNEPEDRLDNILFMVDTSGSMSDKDIADAYSEIKGAIDQFNGKLRGWLGFFDAKVVKPLPFENADDIISIRPKGGGGTRFDIIFKYVREEMEDIPPASIVILTDGCAPFPEESDARGIPVLWVINNDRIEVPWGKVARIK